jgi:hypothetical protein
MTQSYTPKIAKVGLATAVALGSSQMLPVDAGATAAVPSDTLQVGTQTPGQLFEGFEGAGNSIVQSTDFGEAIGQSITGTKTIVLTEPGSTAISDFITASISITGGEIAAFHLEVTLTSDDDLSALAGPASVDETIAETGTVQNLSSDFTTLFGLTNPLPAINVTSDVEPTGVPEPASFSILGAALAAFGWLRRRRKAV